MKRIIFILFIVLSGNNIVMSQSLCAKGTWIMGLNPVTYSPYFKRTNTIYQADTLLNRHTNKSYSINIGFNIGAGYFVRDNFCIGAGFGGSIVGFGSYAIPIIPLNLFARYYIMKKEHCFSFIKQDNSSRYALFVEGVVIGGYWKTNSDNNYVYSSVNNIEEIKTTGYSYGGVAAIGYAYVIVKHIALELLAMYGNQQWTETSNGTYNGTALAKQKNINDVDGINLLFGVQTYF